MPRPEIEPMSYLTKRGRKIFRDILKHVQENDINTEIDILELSMLANSFDVFHSMAEACNRDGHVGAVTGKNGSFDQIKPEYTVMRNEYNNILKHSPKFGMTPGDREKIFGGLKKKKKVDVSDGLE